jgi:hypothetical protein
MSPCSGPRTNHVQNEQSGTVHAGRPRSAPGLTSNTVRSERKTRMLVRSGTIELDEDNIDHVTSDGVTLAEIEATFRTRPTVRRNRSTRSADYYVISNGVRVDFLYRPGVARSVHGGCDARAQRAVGRGPGGRAVRTP